MNKTVMLLFLSALSVSCSHNKNDNNDCTLPDESYIKIFKDDDSVQCDDTSGIPLENMEQELTNSGIAVICSQKDNDGIPVVFLCGADSGNINVYVINKSNLEDAEKIGFRSLDQLLKNESE